MVDEKYEVQQYLEGENIALNNLYRICYLMTCWYKEKNLKRIEVRESIFNWGKKYKVHIRYSLNNIINRIFDDDRIKLRNPVIKINKQDIEEINKRFDDKKTKLVALAMLCYAKAYANKNKEFYISSVGLGAWLGINRKALRSKYIKELIDFEYLKEVCKHKNSSSWTDSYDTQSTRYYINVPIHNSGDNVLMNNDIGLLFSEVFLLPI